LTRFRAYRCCGALVLALHWATILASIALFSVSAQAQTSSSPADSLARLDSLRRIGQLPAADTTGRLRAGFPDTGKTALSDTIKIDTTQHWVVYLDSTARMKEFVHTRDDLPVVELFPHHTYSLYLRATPMVYQRSVDLDTTGTYVAVHEMVNTVDVKVPLRIPLDEYIHQRSAEEVRNTWRALAGNYVMRQNRDELGGLLGNFTNISIPVPSNPLFSNIFGGKEVHLNISGGVDIQGAFRSQSTDQSTISSLDRSSTEPNFKQDVQVSVNGTIGDKLNILADWNTTRTFDYENQLKIKYTGYDDEVIQSIEAGNVSLQTPSLVGGGQALFGIKGKLQFGPLALTALVSQKKGQTKEFNVSGGATSTDIQIFPQNYSTNHFFIDKRYAAYFEQLRSAVVPVLSSDMLANQIIQINVYTTIQNATALVNGNVSVGRAYSDLPPLTATQNGYRQTDLPPGTAPGTFEPGQFVRLTVNKDYTVDQYGGFINLNVSIADNQVVAVQYVLAGSNNKPETCGGFFVDSTGKTTDTLILKLLKPQYLSSNPSYPEWNLMMKNFYHLGVTNVKSAGFSLDIYRRVPGSADVDQLQGKPLLQAFGFDRFDANNQPNPDNQFDFIPNLTIDVDHGELIFPTLRPFDSALIRYYSRLNPPVVTPDSLLIPQVYDTTYTAATVALGNLYYIKAKASGSQTSRFNLGFNIVEGSVVVLYNGVPMTPNVDYTVDYIVGEVVIRKPEALLPGANVQVKYEQNDLFEIASKTLMGVRGELDMFPNTTLGFTAMRLNQATLSDKVRLDEEPTDNSVLGADFSTGFNLPFLTSAIDALPFIRTKEMSSIRFNSEMAYMIPNANTKTSTIPGDNGQSVAYIDDFEGALKTIPLPVSYIGWSPSSGPEQDSLTQSGSDSLRNYTRATLNWYNVLPTDVFTQQIWPNRQTRSGQNQVTVLNLDFDPNRRGVYNFSPNVDSTLHRKQIRGYPNSGKFDTASARERNWNGVMRYIGASAGSLLEQNITTLELWVKAEPDDPNDLKDGRLYFDLGRITEAVIPFPPHKLYSEDMVQTPSNPQGIPNGVLNYADGEDVGLDMLSDPQEAVTYADFLKQNRGDPDVDPGDPSGDDWTPYNNGTNLTKFNGTEGNHADPAGLLPNTEDLNGNASLDEDDEYAEYALTLDTTGNPYHVGGQGGWYQYKIPLLLPQHTFPNSETVTSILQNVQYFRVWISGFASPVRIRIAEMNIIGNQWTPVRQNDSVLQVSAVNIEDNPDYADEWGQMGIIRELDRTDPSQVIAGNEQSLALLLTDLPFDSAREATKYFTVRPLDLFNYSTLKMFVHGDHTWTYLSEGEHDAEIYLRFGTDSLNYYEYREPIHQGWNVGFNDITVEFEKLTALKTARDSINQYKSETVIGGPPGAVYGVKGNPSLRQVYQITIGIINTGRSPTLTGQVWVNELRVVGVDNSHGLAYKMDTQIKLADFGSVSANITSTDPYFHALDQRFGSQTSTINWSVNASASLDKFFSPDWQGTSIPIGYSHTEQLIKPRYLPNSDVVVTSAAALAQQRALDSAKTSQQASQIGNDLITSSQTLSVQNSYSLSNLRIVFPTQAWYIRDTFSKLSFAFTYNNAKYRDPTITERSSWLWNVRVNYAVNLPTDYYVQPFHSLFNGLFILDDFKDWRLYYMPVMNLSGSAGGDRSRSYQISSIQGAPPLESRLFDASKSVGFGWKLTEGGLTNISGDYGLSISRNLLPLDNDSVGGRSFGSLIHNLFFGGRDGQYGQRITVNTRPKIPNILDIPKYLDVSGTYAVNYAWQNSFQEGAGDLSKSAGWDNNINMNFTFRLKSLIDPWFESSDEPTPPQGQYQPPSKQSDTTHKGAPDTSKAGGSAKKLLPQLKSLARAFIKVPFLDYESIAITFTQTNRTGSGGVLGTTGFQNFWGRLPFQGSTIENGPSRLYQLGLISDPSGTLQFAPSSSFPFFHWNVIPGPRAVNGNLTDQFSETNNLALRTTRPLWTGATLELNWKVGWQFSKTTTITTDSIYGIPTPSVPQTSGSIERSYLSLPPFLLFKVLKSNLEEVGKQYDQVDKTLPQAELNAALAQSFEKGLEALPFLNKVFGEYMPRANWTLRWDGIEKVLGISSIVDRLSLEHAYSSTFHRDYRSYAGVGEETDDERVTYGFAPLAGITASFKELWKGTMSGTFRYNTTTAYDLNLASTPPDIVETFSQEISFSLTYSRKGFSFPLFGLNLSNDVDLTMTFSLTKNTRQRYDPTTLSSDQTGVPLDGSTQTNMEPSIRYVLSTRVTASLYYKYSNTSPAAGGSLIFGTTSNEAGVNIHISI